MKERTGLSILYHVLFWSLIWSVPFLLLPMIEPWETHYADVSLSRLAYIPLMTGSFYFNLFVLYPRYMQLRSGDQVAVELQCVDPVVYLYFLTFSQYTGTGRGLPIAPGNPLSNISNGALGYFNAHTTSTKTMVVP